jgi:DNA-binding transcriptional ArsR family regulator
LNSDTLSEKEAKKLKSQIKTKTDVVESLNSLIRIRILILLWAYKEQSVNDLCEKLGKSWPTVNKHLNILKDAGLLDLRKVKSPGPKDKKLFSAKPEIIKFTRLGFDFLNLDPEEVMDILIEDIKSDEKTLEIIKKIFEDLIPYHEELLRKLTELDLTNEELEDFYKTKHVNYYVEVLDETEFEYYFERYREFLKDIAEFKEKRREKLGDEKKEKPYAAFHILLPLKEIQDARFKRFWNQ